MDFATPPSLEPVLGRMSAFVEGELIPREPDLFTRGFNACEPELRSLRARVRELGLWAPQLPRELGGMGLSLLEHGLVSEVLGRSPLGHYVFGCAAPDAGNVEILEAHATPAQRRRFLEPLARGEVRSCFAMTEPEHAGSNPTEMSTRARLEGGEWILDGHKWFASSAEGTDFAVVMAVTDPEAPRHARASLILVPTGTPGFVRVRNVPVMGHAGEGYFSHAELRFSGCRVPAENLLGERGKGFAIAQERLGAGRIHHCMRWIGICERAFAMMCLRAAGREVAGGEPLAAKEIVQAWIAECRARIDAARLLVLKAAWRIDREGQKAAREEVSLIKFHVAEVLQETIDRAIQVHGALGLTDDTILASWWAHERGARIYDGPDEVHKVAAARSVLKRLAPGGEDVAPVRRGEELDEGRLAAWLEGALARKGTLAVSQFPRGHSNLTYLLRYAGEDYVLRRPPFGARVKTAHDMGREYRVLSALAPVWPRAPRPVAFCEDEAVIGAKFYLMRRVPGLVLRRDPPRGVAIDPAAAGRICRSFADVLAELHAIDYRAVGLSDFGQPEGYVARQVAGWTTRYEDARTDEIPEVVEVARWLAAHLPPPGGAALLHNDYKLDNLVLDPMDLGRVVGILDWEMAALGDPLMDLGTALCYWVEPRDPEALRRFRFGPTDLPGMATRRGNAEAYAEKTGRDLGHLSFYYAFGLFKTAVVAQQIYARWVHGHTRDERFGTFVDAVRALARQAAAAIERPELL